MTGLANGGMVTGAARLDALAVAIPGHVPAGGTCIRLPDGSHEWIIPVSPENTRRNLAILAEAKRKLTLDNFTTTPGAYYPALSED